MNNTSDYQQLLDDAKSYLQTRYDLLRLELLDKLSLLLGIVILTLVLLFLAFGGIAFVSVCVVHLLSKVMPMWAASALLGALLFFVGWLVYRLRVPLFYNPMIKMLSGVLFGEATQPAGSQPSEPMTTAEQGKEATDEAK